LTTNRDPGGLYNALQLPHTATEAEIRAAYKRLARDFHPDRNPSASASTSFQRIREAFEVLGDPSSRAEYDAISAGSGTGGTSHGGLAKLACGECGLESPDLRFVVLYRAYSLLFFTSREPRPGIFCPKCAEAVAFRSNIFTMFLGWWGVPWGPIYSFHALGTNSFAGVKPPEINAKILTYQATAFATTGDLPTANRIAHRALEFAKQMPRRGIILTDPAKDRNRTDRMLDAQKVIELTGGDLAASKATSWMWSIFPRAASVTFIGPLAALILFSAVQESVRTDRSERRHAVSDITSSHTDSNYKRSATAPNGQPWPSVPGYLLGTQVLHNDGYSVVTIDNTKSSSDMHVKLATHEGRPTTVREAYVPSGQSFKIEQIAPGTYTIRFMNLETGSAFRAEPFSLSERNVGDQVEYSDYSLTLYKTYGGNAKTAAIDIRDF
jgi:hypothetical protein